MGSVKGRVNASKCGISVGVQKRGNYSDYGWAGTCSKTATGSRPVAPVGADLVQDPMIVGDIDAERERIINSNIDDLLQSSDDGQKNSSAAPMEEQIVDKELPKAWSKGDSSKLFKANRVASNDVRLKFIEPVSNVVEISEYGVSHEWDFTLIGYFTGRFLGLKAVHDLCKTWNVKYSLKSHESGWLMFKLRSEEDVEGVLNGGPYSKWGHMLMLKKCR
ncbi:hypothetical protein ACS0TY_033699 [Phlomoides rotata]